MEKIKELKKQYKEKRVVLKKEEVKAWRRLIVKLDNNLWGDAYKSARKKIKSLYAMQLSAEHTSEIDKGSHNLMPGEL